MFGLADDLIKQFEQPPLLRSHELGVADNVDEEHIGDLELDLLLNLCGHSGEFYSVTSEGSTSFFRRERGDTPSVRAGLAVNLRAWLEGDGLFWSKRIHDFFEARIAAQWIPVRQQFQLAITESVWQPHGCFELLERQIFFANPRCDDRQVLDDSDAVDGILVQWKQLYSTPSFLHSLLLATFSIAARSFTRAEASVWWSGRVSALASKSIDTRATLVSTSSGLMSSARSRTAASSL